MRLDGCAVAGVEGVGFHPALFKNVGDQSADAIKALFGRNGDEVLNTNDDAFDGFKLKTAAAGGADISNNFPTNTRHRQQEGLEV